MKLGVLNKQPGEKRRYVVDYSNSLSLGDTVISAAAEVSPAGELTASATYTTDTVVVTCDGGVDGTRYKVTITTTTTDSNEIFEDELYVKVKEI